MYSLKGKVAIVTGSGRGIGRSIALRLCSEGAKVVINAKKGAEQAEQTLSQVVSMGGEGAVFLADVSTREGCSALVRAAMGKFGSLDILVNNAGLGLLKPFLESDDALIEKVVATSLKSAIYCSQEAGKVMNEGVIINISSLAGIFPFKGLSVYSIAKGGIHALTKALAVELAPRIRVNAISPGVVKTKMGDSLLAALGIDEREWARRYTLLNKLIGPEEVAEAVTTMIKIPSMTGQVLVLDAGQSLIAGVVR